MLEIPEEKRFWAEHIEEHPEGTFGGNRARLSFLEKVFTKPNARVFERRMEVSPCGSDCSRCPAYRRCPGCPATVYFLIFSSGG